MAFVSTIQNDREVDISILEREGECLGRVLIGYDDISNATYSVVCAISRRAAMPGEWEIYFNIVEAFDGGDEEWFNDGTQTARFLLGGNRESALYCICHIVPILAERVAAEVIAMTTVTAYLPEKALRKYDAICEALAPHGYEVGRGDPYAGSHIWMMRKGER